MKRFFILLLVALIAGTGLFAEESVLIDFNQLGADFSVSDDGEPSENEATLIDFSVVAGSSYTQEEKAQMKTSLFIENWEVVLNSSARSVVNQSNSFTRAALVREGAAQYPNETILGVRVHFPDEPFNSWALVKPPFEIPAYMDATTVAADGTLEVPQEEVGRGRKFDGYGVVKNIGVLKSISVNVHGLNFPHGLSIIFKDQNNVEQEYFMGYLNFDGWRTLTWNNPNYIAEVRNRELNTFPLYPNSAPMVKLMGFRVYRDAAMEGGDFIAYIKDVSVVYDKAVLSLERDIDDEAVWGILQDREESRRNSELKRLGNLQVLRYLERQKMDASAE
ncbi:flagellar filament outer layer protein FlaA [Spirochaeta lutea]|uniref:Flagellar protein n=1 Tax=Spirochaeta lutea TaxID=1480694 RepID=A0A098R0R1_9SPIO|nr:flagellar filament outer layer protein FlaA [Spirochaeta lutea]KGE73755.1 flagellar protein [Spirochaeta lutea]